MRSTRASGVGIVAETRRKLGRLSATRPPAFKTPVRTIALAVFLCLGAVRAADSQEANNGYPTAIVPLPPGMLLCIRLEDVERTFENWKHSFEHQLPERLPPGCEKNLSGALLVRLEFIRPFQNEHLSADLLRLYIFTRPAAGTLIFEKIAFGYGSVRIKQGILTTLPKPTGT